MCAWVCHAFSTRRNKRNQAAAHSAAVPRASREREHSQKRGRVSGLRGCFRGPLRACRRPTLIYRATTPARAAAYVLVRLPKKFGKVTKHCVYLTNFSFSTQQLPPRRQERERREEQGLGWRMSRKMGDVCSTCYKRASAKMKLHFGRIFICVKACFNK